MQTVLFFPQNHQRNLPARRRIVDTRVGAAVAYARCCSRKPGKNLIAWERCMDLKNPSWMYLKAALFVLMGATCFELVWLEQRTLLTAALLLLMIWAFCRAYYFAFYVIEKYVDPHYKFSGLLDFCRYLLRRRP